MGKFDKDVSLGYQLKDKTNGVYAFVLKGDFTINNHLLNNRDGLGVWDVDSLNIVANSANSELLLMEVPMSV
jgi:redox-sensitive bicupin YhaK (pirin superfamily)